MTQLLIGLCYWLHSLATVIFIGHYLLLSLIYLPVMTKPEHSAGAMLSEISKRSRPWMYASLLAFIVSGVYLTVADANYLGLGNFGNVWGMLMLVKHVLILGMIVVGFWAILRVGPSMSSNNGASAAMARFRLYSLIMAISGVLVLLLTAFAQIQ